MNYETAKELKDAGFPQLELIPDKDGNVDIPGKFYNFGEENQVYAPELSELIEACEDKMDCFRLEKDCIIKFNGKENVQHWRAECMSTSWSNNKIEFFGSTPEEAVARLWLALNKDVK